MSKRTIKWICTAETGWEWLSGSEGQPSFKVDGDPTREGEITLPPNKDYWYPCVELIVQGRTTGNAYLRYFSEDGRDKVQAITVAQNVWIRKGEPGEKSSETNSKDVGINLWAEFI